MKPNVGLNSIQIDPIGYVERTSEDENNKNRNLVSKIIIKESLTKALDGIEDFSHIYVIFWMDKLKNKAKTILHHPSNLNKSKPIGIFATRAPIHPNPIGLTIVELIKREKNVLWVRGIDAYEGTPVIDIKPYPDWNQGICIVVTDFKIPKWIKKKKD
jgi:tRNA-Thr(GGU) m(6)t(6)A37 methyltransferase TsaA